MTTTIGEKVRYLGIVGIKKYHASTLLQYSQRRDMFLPSRIVWREVERSGVISQKKTARSRTNVLG